MSWLPLVYEVAARFHATTRGRRNIYIVRLDYSDRDAHLQGISISDDGTNRRGGKVTVQGAHVESVLLEPHSPS